MKMMVKRIKYNNEMFERCIISWNIMNSSSDNKFKNNSNLEIEHKKTSENESKNINIKDSIELKSINNENVDSIVLEVKNEQNYIAKVTSPPTVEYVDLNDKQQDIVPNSKMNTQEIIVPILKEENQQEILIAKPKKDIVILHYSKIEETFTKNEEIKNPIIDPAINAEINPLLNPKLTDQQRQEMFKKRQQDLFKIGSPRIFSHNVLQKNEGFNSPDRKETINKTINTTIPTIKSTPSIPYDDVGINIEITNGSSCHRLGVGCDSAQIGISEGQMLQCT